MALRSVSLCAGIGCIDLALRRLGVARSVLYVEREIQAAARLVARIEEGALDSAPVWSDLRTLDARAWRGRVDLVTSGLPCQPYSVAGKRRGNDDERALWPEFVRIVRDCEPAFVFIENVPPFLKHCEPVWRELRSLGFEWAPPLHATSAHVGGIDDRRRLFLLAAHRDRAELRHEQGRRDGARRCGEAEPGDVGAVDADAACVSRREPRNARLREARWPSAERSSRLATHSDGHGQPFEWCGWVFDRERQTLRHDADRCNRGCRTAGSPWEVESPPCRVDAGAANRLDQLFVLGNGVNVEVAMMAWTMLRDALTHRRGRLTC